MAICSNCGNEVAIGIAKCPECGNAINLDYQSQGDQYTEDQFVYKRYNIFQRIFFVLFSRDIQADICNNNYNVQAIILFLIMFLIAEIQIYLTYLPVLNPNSRYYSDSNHIFLRAFLANEIFILISSFTFVGFSLIGNLITGKGNSYMKIFRLYIFMNVILTLIHNLLSSLFLGRLLFQFGPYGTVTIINIYFAIQLSIQLLLVSVGFRTLFNCNYVKAVFLTIIPLVANQLVLYGIFYLFGFKINLIEGVYGHF